MPDVPRAGHGQRDDRDPTPFGNRDEGDGEAARGRRDKQVLRAPVPARSVELERHGNVDRFEDRRRHAGDLVVLPAGGDGKAEVLGNRHDSLLSCSPESSPQIAPDSPAPPPIRVAANYGRRAFADGRRRRSEDAPIGLTGKYGSGRADPKGRGGRG